MRTKQEFIDRWKHILGGMILDGATSVRSGAELSQFLRTILDKVDGHLGLMWTELQPPVIAPEKPIEKPKPPANGSNTTVQPQRKVGP